jgi:hypothetical protein
LKELAKGFDKKESLEAFDHRIYSKDRSGRDRGYKYKKEVQAILKMGERNRGEDHSITAWH